MKASKKQSTSSVFTTPRLSRAPLFSECKVIAGVKIAFAPLDGASKLVSTTSPQIRVDNSPDCAIAGGKIASIFKNLPKYWDIYEESD